MSVEDRLLQVEKTLKRIEEKQDEHWESYRRILTSVLEKLGGDIEKVEVEG